MCVNESGYKCLVLPEPSLIANMKSITFILVRSNGYGICSKIFNTLLFMFSNKMLVSRAGIHKTGVRVANRKNPDQTASSESV